MSHPPTTDQHHIAFEVILGVDTHKDIHVAVAISNHGVLLGSRSYPTTAEGYCGLLDWATGLGRVRLAGDSGAMVGQDLVLRVSSADRGRFSAEQRSAGRSAEREHHVDLGKPILPTASDRTPRKATPVCPWREDCCLYLRKSHRGRVRHPGGVRTISSKPRVARIATTQSTINATA
jgi:hypothetical protein